MSPNEERESARAAFRLESTHSSSLFCLLFFKFIFVFMLIYFIRKKFFSNQFIFYFRNFEMFRPGNLINGEDPTSLIRSFMPTPVHQSVSVFNKTEQLRFDVLLLFCFQDNLRVPTTPLKDHVEETNNNEVNQFMPSKIPMAIPSSSSSVRLDTPSPLIENIVATCFLGLNVNLKHVALHARNAEYNPKRFAAVIMRIREPRTTALIFNSGKMVITGAKSEEASKLAARKFARIIQKLGFDAKFLDFKVSITTNTVIAKYFLKIREPLFFSDPKPCCRCRCSFRHLPRRTQHRPQSVQYLRTRNLSRPHLQNGQAKGCPFNFRQREGKCYNLTLNGKYKEV